MQNRSSSGKKISSFPYTLLLGTRLCTPISTKVESFFPCCMHFRRLVQMVSSQKRQRNQLFFPQKQGFGSKKKKKIPFWKSVPLFSGITQTHPYGMWKAPETFKRVITWKGRLTTSERLMNWMRLATTYILYSHAKHMHVNLHEYTSPILNLVLLENALIVVVVVFFFYIFYFLAFRRWDGYG